MRLIDATTITSKHHLYLLEPQPMYRYDNYEEFTQNVQDYRLVTNFPELLIACRDLNITLEYSDMSKILVEGSRSTLISDKNLWVKTIDKFIPDYANIGGDIFYQKDEQGNAIPTDGCYIKIIALIGLPNRLVLYTSTGVNSVGITKWAITGAVRTQFIQERNNKPTGTGEAYQKYISSLKNKTRPDTNMYKFLFALLHPQSSALMNPQKAKALSYGNKIRSADTDKIFESPSFRQAMAQVIKMIFPELTKKARDKFPVESLLEMLQTAKGKAEGEKGTVSDILTVFDKIKGIAYEEELTVSSTVPQLPTIEQLSNSATAKPQEIAAVKVETIDTVEEMKNLATPAFGKDEIAILREEMGAVDSFVFDEPQTYVDETKE